MKTAYIAFIAANQVNADDHVIPGGVGAALLGQGCDANGTNNGCAEDLRCATEGVGLTVVAPVDTKPAAPPKPTCSKKPDEPPKPTEPTKPVGGPADPGAEPAADPEPAAPGAEPQKTLKIWDTATEDCSTAPPSILTRVE